MLDAGSRQTAAIVLHVSAGFTRIAPLGPCADDPTSVCFEKHLAPPLPLRRVHPAPAESTRSPRRRVADVGPDDRD